ncbi:Rhodanese-like domain containing protein [Elaphomyces granulatus]
MSPSSRPLASLASRALRSTTTTACRLTTTTSRCYYTTTERRNIRGKPSKEEPSFSLARCIFSGSHQEQHRRQQQKSLLSRQIRWKSDNNNGRSDDDKVGVPELRTVGFEEINATLPSPRQSSSSSSSKSSPVLIDVREPAELSATGIIPGAVSVPLASQPDALFLTPDEFETRFGFPKPGVVATDDGQGQQQQQYRDVVFYCKAGVRARSAAQLAIQAGYDPPRVFVYDGSWLDWADRGGRVEKWEGDLE